jgi:hypothetical protein
VKRGGRATVATGEKERSQKKTFQSSKRQKSVRDDIKGRLSDRLFKRTADTLAKHRLPGLECLQP